MINVRLKLADVFFKCLYVVRAGHAAAARFLVAELQNRGEAASLFGERDCLHKRALGGPIGTSGLGRTPPHWLAASPVLGKPHTARFFLLFSAITPEALNRISH